LIFGRNHDLGNHNSGKSTIALSLASRTAEFTNAVETKEALDLGLSYSCFNVGEESEEGDSLSNSAIDVY
jgi:hypothetical protein